MFYYQKQLLQNLQQLNDVLVHLQKRYFFMCLDMVDLFLSNKSASWSKDSHTVSSSGEILTSSSNCSSLKVTMLVISKNFFPDFK